MNWSGPNVIHFDRKSQFGPDQFGHDHFILVETKSSWSSPNQFGQTKTILDRSKLFWSHRRTRPKSDKIWGGGNCPPVLFSSAGPAVSSQNYKNQTLKYNVLNQILHLAINKYLVKVKVFFC